MTESTSEFSVSAAESSAVTRPICGPFCAGVIAASVLLLSACALGWSPPDWIQPSIVGLLWANLFLIGVAAGHVRRGSAGFACLAGGLLWLSQIALSIVTHLSSAECLLVATLLCGSGWSVAQLDNIHRDLRQSCSSALQFRQWTIWDLAILTTFVAVVCFAAPKLESPAALLINVAFVLVGGVVCSWIAYRWVFDDRWNVGKLLAILAGGVLSLWLIGRQAPPESSLLQLLAWMLTGPLAVIASQGLAVLVLLSAVRVDLGNRNSGELSTPVPTAAPGLRIYSV